MIMSEPILVSTLGVKAMEATKLEKLDQKDACESSGGDFHLA